MGEHRQNRKTTISNLLRSLANRVWWRVWVGNLSDIRTRSGVIGGRRIHRHYPVNILYWGGLEGTGELGSGQMARAT